MSQSHDAAIRMPKVKEPSVIIGSREQLLHLLAEAAEIEHTLMCTYLYAAFSLKRSGEGISAQAAEHTERWRKSIITVAIEEMGHLVLVANLTVAIGGRPHFARPNFPVSEGYFPSDIVVRLAPFSKDTIDHFVYLERPRGTRGTDGETFQEPEYAREQPHTGIMPGGQDYKTVGHLYRAIRENLRALHKSLGAESLFVGERHHQLGGSLTGIAGLELIDDLASAERAIDLIVEQGEGSDDQRDDSHYNVFLDIQKDLERLSTDGAELTWPSATSPVLRSPSDPSDRTWIDHPDSAALLDLGCATYGLLLRMLVQCFGRAGLGYEMHQKRLFKVAITLMHAVAEIGDALARLPASRSQPALNAGLTFTMLRGVEPLLSGRAEQLVLLEQLEQVSATAAAHNLSCALALQKATDTLRQS